MNKLEELKAEMVREREINRQILVDMVLRLNALCEAAGVDPDTLEDGIEMLYARIVELRTKAEGK